MTWWRIFGALGSHAALALLASALLGGASIDDPGRLFGGGFLALLVIAPTFGLGYTFGMTREP